MIYDLYFHNDMDGVASAAVMLDFLRGKGERVERFIALDYLVIPEWKRENFFTKNKYCGGSRNLPVVVDFPYHPKAYFWFDHHASTFKKPEWEKKFKLETSVIATPHLLDAEKVRGKQSLREGSPREYLRDDKAIKFHHFDQKYLSCCHLVMDTLTMNFAYKPSRHIKELSKWLDIIDAAKYKSAAQTIELKEPALQISACVEHQKKSGSAYRPFVEALAVMPLQKAVKENKIARLIKKLVSENKKSLGYYEANVEARGAVSIVDESALKGNLLRFASFYFYPKARFGIRFCKDEKKKSFYHISAGVNPWNTPKKFPHIGRTLSKFGGGGHAKVGGVEVRGEKKVKEIVEWLVQFLRNYSN